MAVMNEQVIHVDEPLSLIADVFDHQEKLYEVGFKTLSYDQLSTLFGKLGLSYTAAEIETEAGMHDHADPVPVEDFTDLFFESWKQSEKLDVTDKAAMQEYFLENDENKDGQLTMLEATSLLSKVNIDATINYDQFEDLAENMAEVIGITVPNIEDNTHLENWDNETGRPLPETPAAV